MNDSNSGGEAPITPDQRHHRLQPSVLARVLWGVCGGGRALQGDFGEVSGLQRCDLAPGLRAPGMIIVAWNAVERGEERFFICSLASPFHPFRSYLPYFVLQSSVNNKRSTGRTTRP